VVREGHGGHFVVPGFLEQVGKADGAVEEAVLGVEVEVNEIDVLHELLTYWFKRIYQ
jgi:hypothetical protein